MSWYFDDTVSKSLLIMHHFQPVMKCMYKPLSISLNMHHHKSKKMRWLMNTNNLLQTVKQKSKMSLFTSKFIILQNVLLPYLKNVILNIVLRSLFKVWRCRKYEKYFLRFPVVYDVFNWYINVRWDVLFDICVRGWTSYSIIKWRILNLLRLKWKVYKKVCCWFLLDGFYPKKITSVNTLAENAYLFHSPQSWVA